MAARVTFTEQQTADIKAKYAEGLSTREIAEAFDCSRQPIEYALKSSGVYKGREGTRALSPAEEREVVRRYRAGETINTICNSYGRSRKPVERVLKAEGIYVGRHFEGFTAEEEAAIVARYQAREGANTIAKSLDCGRGPIVTVLERHGVYERRRFQGFTPEERDDIFEKYRAGAKPSELAREFKVGQVTIDRMLKRYDVWVHPSSLERVASRFTVEQKLQMAEEYKAGDSIYKIGARYDTRPQLIWKILQAAGVEFRDKAWKGGKLASYGGKYISIAIDPTDPYAVMANVGGYVLEHRLVMAKSIGRPLTSTETVHHINGDGTDNRIENLQLRKGNHGKGVVMACLDCGSHNIDSVPLPESAA